MIVYDEKHMQKQKELMCVLVVVTRKTKTEKNGCGC